MAAPLPSVPISRDGRGTAEVTMLGGGSRDVRSVLSTVNPPCKRFLCVLNPQAAVRKIKTGGEEVGPGKPSIFSQIAQCWPPGSWEQWLPLTGLEPNCDAARVCVGVRVGSFLLSGPGWAPEAQPLHAWAGSGCILFLCFL